MNEDESKEVRLEDEQERLLTLKIDLEGPAEFLRWMRANTPPRFGRRLSGLLPSEFRRHVRAAQREQLLAVRSLLDAAIQRMETEEKPPRKAVDVDVE